VIIGIYHFVGPKGEIKVCADHVFTRLKIRRIAGLEMLALFLSAVTKQPLNAELNGVV
jgi:hypothetical protein